MCAYDCARKRICELIHVCVLGVTGELGQYPVDTNLEGLFCVSPSVFFVCLCCLCCVDVVCRRVRAHIIAYTYSTLVYIHSHKRRRLNPHPHNKNSLACSLALSLSLSLPLHPLLSITLPPSPHLPPSQHSVFCALSCTQKVFSIDGICSLSKERATYPHSSQHTQTDRQIDRHQCTCVHKHTQIVLIQLLAHVCR